MEPWQEELISAYQEKRKAAEGNVFEIYIGRRVWDALTAPGVDLLSFNPWDAHRHAMTKDGYPIFVRENFKGNRIDVVTHQQSEVLNQVKTLVLNAMRETGERPEIIEMGTETWELFQAARLGAPLENFEGTPIVLVEIGNPKALRVQRNERPPEWCQVGVCVVKAADHEVWATIIGMSPGKIFLDEVGDDRNVPISLREIREDWVKIPPRVRVRDRFSRVLDD